MENEKVAGGRGLKRIRLVISGDVVGVGYRRWVRSVARDLHLRGWVINREDRTVELVAEGEKEALEKLFTASRKGPDVSWVERVEVQWLPATGGLPGFEVVY